jgi:AcrR family transcriptional regulator
MTTAPTLTRRERARAATIKEIQRTALQLMREQATTDIRFTDIARVMGMTAPGLYRYYADRDHLLTDLIADAYGELGAAVAAAREAVSPDDIGGRWLATATAYREWARSEPQRFALILGMPVPGYAAPDEGPTTEAAAAAMGELAELFVRAATKGKLRKPLIRDVSPQMVECAQDKHPELDDVVPPESFQAMLSAWASLHGFTSLETYGHLDWIGEEARDELFRSHMEMVAKAAGLPAPAARSTAKG